MKPAAAPVRYPHADLWAVGALFFLSRMDWMVSLLYHGSANTHAASTIFAALGASLTITLLGYAFARFAAERVVALVARALVLAMWLYFVWVTFRQFLLGGENLTGSVRMVVALAALAMTGFGAVFLAHVWQRLRSALIAAALIGAFSPFVLVAALAPRIALLADPGPHPRPVIVLVLDEFSAGSAHGLADALSARQLRVGAWSVPSIGENTLDAIPALLTGAALPEARACTPTAVCGRGRAVNLARISVARNDVDVFGFHHPYCVMAGLRSCVITDRILDRPAAVLLLCSLPLRWMIDPWIECGLPPSDPTQPNGLANAQAAIQRAPFWTRGGVLYAHVLIPHPPGLAGELSLADAYAGNVAQAERFVLSLVDRLDQSTLRDDYTLVITSDHPLRLSSWCKKEPYATHGCEVPASMRTPEVPFIVATRGTEVRHRIPRSNVDLLPVVGEVGATR